MPKQQNQPTSSPSTQEQTPCDECDGTGWVSFPDPLFDGAYIDARCPCGTVTER